MKTSFYLTVNSTGSIKATKNQPALGWNEVSIHMTLDLPDVLFKKPRLTASISVDADQVAPHQIDVSMIDNIQDALKQVIGTEVRITIDGNETV